MSERTIILNHEDIEIRIQRIAHEILENNYKEKELYFIGIADQGFLLAQLINNYFCQICDIKTSVHQLNINKKSPLSAPMKILPQVVLNDKTVILFDDVLNSGKTLAYSAKALLNYPLKRLETVVMVNRRHRDFPIRADYVGLTLSTTLQDHITVELNSKEKRAYLN